ncbi:tether containing UBX domain for GLUT4 isoform X2 [Dunckerocampus dactyliophorus]|uniref:tether containing UBX domain for GLUT4 isoform X2 n=1 Tax=Dunckerocampus dactyliophorus TaxID=161453 RepID=UPI00240753C2|nr:tether containing UBX domain for GLUT4 isoform X2 [Dunckerocampus dactyliophorus]
MAANGTAVTVLTPNGRRQTVKVLPNTPLLQVLEDVCKKHGFDPDSYGLKFQRTVLDLTLQWRFANLPNNAKLEVVPSTRNQTLPDSQVRIALQMEDGSRLQSCFSCGQSLWEVLTHFPQISVSELSQAGSTPVCVYMRDEVCGEEALKKATLKSLGLTGGSAIVRFLLKKKKAQEEEDGMDTTGPAADEYPAGSPAQPAPSRSPSSASHVKAKNANPSLPKEIVPAPCPVSATSTLPVQEDSVAKVQLVAQPEGRGLPEDDGEEAGPSKIIPRSPAPFIPFSGGGQRLGGTGGSAVRPSSSLSFSSLSSAVESPKAKKAKPSNSSSAKHGPTANKPSEDIDESVTFLQPVEREPLIYHMESRSRNAKDDVELPDEFFEVTVDDVRKRFAQLKSERKLLEEAPLMTKTLRETQMKEKMDRYPKVVLRVEFPDRHVLQGFFRPLETVGALVHFVRSHLEDPQLTFYLFITPPKRILEDLSVTLFQADLFPGALVYFGCDVKTDLYLKKELLSSSVSALQANESIASCILQPTEHSSSSSAAEDGRPPPLEPSPDTSASTEDDENLSANIPRAAKTNRSDVGKVPKWLKLPGKK